VGRDHHAFGRLDAQRFRGGLEDLPDPPSPQADARRTTLQLVVESPAGINLDGEDEPPMWYVIAVPTRPVPEPTEPVQLEEGELFVLADNRALPFAPIGARHGGRVVDRDWVVGRPLYVLFSLGPDNAIRWHRIGLRLR